MTLMVKCKGCGSSFSSKIQSYRYNKAYKEKSGVEEIEAKFGKKQKGSKKKGRKKGRRRKK